MKTVLLLPHGTDSTASSRARIYDIEEDLRSYLDVRLSSPIINENASNRLFKGFSLLRNNIHKIGAASKRDIDTVIYHKGVGQLGGYLQPLIIKKVLGKQLIFDLDDATFLHNNKVYEVFELADAVFAGSHYLKEEAEKYNDNVYLVPTAIDTEKFRPIDDVTPPEERFVVGWVGGASEHRENLRMIIEPFEDLCREHDDLVLRLIGMKGEDELKQEFRDSDVKVELIDWVKPDDVPEEINKFDIGIMPLVDHPWERGKCSLKALEYMSCGVPAVCSAVGENNYVIKDGVNGFLTENTKKAWIKAVKDSRNRDLNQISEESRETVNQRYSIENTAKNVAGILKDHD